MSYQPFAECLFHRSHGSVSCVDHFIFLHEETTHFSYSVDPLKNDASVNWRWRRNTFFRKRFLLVYLHLKHTKAASALYFFLAIKHSIFFFTSPYTVLLHETVELVFFFQQNVSQHVSMTHTWQKHCKWTLRAVKSVSRLHWPPTFCLSHHFTGLMYTVDCLTAWPSLASAGVSWILCLEGNCRGLLAVPSW